MLMNLYDYDSMKWFQITKSVTNFQNVNKCILFKIYYRNIILRYGAASGQMCNF